jgi:hypothetical protein
MLLQDEAESWLLRNHVQIPFRELVARIRSKAPLDEPGWIVRRGDKRKIVARFDNEAEAGQRRRPVSPAKG